MEGFVKILKIIVLVLFLLVLGLGIFAVIKTKTAKKNLEAESKMAGGFESNKNDEVLLFGDVGTLRIQTKDNVILVVAPYFEYGKNDIAFQEELVKKKQNIRKIIIDFFSGCKIAEIKTLGDEGVKSVILDSVNKILTLNQIQNIYFEKYIILE